jgi:signal transduction histidine kinase
MADNLIDNAVRHNTAEGWIEIRTESAGGEARLEISNSGTVMTAEEAASLTEPFRRRGTARTGDGLGLGLSIAASVAQAHGGQLTLDPVQRGGLHVSVALPTARVSGDRRTDTSRLLARPVAAATRNQRALDLRMPPLGPRETSPSPALFVRDCTHTPYP